ncbi:hypothetical protein [Vibrio phage vB_ValA_R15Z]|uniref:DUF3310 domain-containing protein n=1 Tax=Vibrio phage vB_ValA_R15Z TaxID=3044218 RepID=A0AA50AH78_9CAUD|nr:hypothetical protein [Vibrio phage vB_ValA_R15Z]
MNKESCSSFIFGASCSGYPDSEMCTKCPCMRAGCRTTPLQLKCIREDGDFYEEQKITSKASETQVGGSHYIDMGIQPLEFTYANYGYTGLKAAIHTKVNKYLGRKKDNEVQQLEKAKHCIELLIEKAKLQ